MVKELVTFVVQQLVSHPQEVVVSMSEKDDSNLLEIKVAPEDRGRVIGKEGHTIKSLRALIDAAVPHGKKVSLELSR
ncbi:MAG TPA: KH domain-containing protein [Candidatus Babeliales bacterium]|jgi:predicted RNA-binding protein YlqC (UPF0109 family)|nr:KH domain-containing protein [Candidatus Babeliales bacterium]